MLTAVCVETGAAVTGTILGTVTLGASSMTEAVFLVLAAMPPMLFPGLFPLLLSLRSGRNRLCATTA